MELPSDSIRAWARRLVATEADSLSNSANVVRVCEKLRICLAEFVGPDGFTALLRRAVALARADAPVLDRVKVTPDGRLQGLEALAASPAKDTEVPAAITAHLLQLLVTFIGESLTRRLLRVEWPETFDRTNVKPEDLR